MKLELLSGGPKLKEGQICVNMYIRDSGVNIYDSKGNGARVPLEEIDEFIDYIKNGVNGNHNVKVSLGKRKYLVLPKSKIEKISEKVLIAKHLSEGYIVAYQEIIR